MTGPSSTSRPRVDQLTDDMLDQLYAERDQLAIRVWNAEDASTAWERKADEQQARAEKAEAAIARVRALHAPGRDWSWKPFGCEHHGAHAQPCAHCGVCSPCPTLTALDTTA